MGWLKKIFTGSNHKIHEGQYGAKSNNRGELSDHGREDIDRAIALSLLEEEQETAQVIGDGSHLEEDEQLARALQESLNVGSSNENRHIYQSMPFFFPSVFRTCSGCKNEIYGRFLNCMGGIWHPECFCCHACNYPISDGEFSISRNYAYHKSCYKEHYHPKCDVCNQFIPSNFSGQMAYRMHPFWNKKYCPSHDHDNTLQCCSCERMEPRNSLYVSLDDGRKLCLECLDSAIMDTNECQPLYLDIQNFFEGLNMKIEQDVPMLLVERQALNEAMDGEDNGHTQIAETRGLCLSEVQIVRTISKRPKFGAGKRIRDITTQPYKLIRRCEVTAILVLYGLPRLLTGAILAHEMMHAWMRLNGFQRNSLQVEEGICQVIGHMWLESEIMSGSGSSRASSSSSSSRSAKRTGRASRLEKKLGEFFKHQIEIDSSRVYGDGFRAANQAVLKYGLRTTLEHIRVTGNLP